MLVIFRQGSYSGGGKGGYSRFRSNLFQHATTFQLLAFWDPKSKPKFMKSPKRSLPDPLQEQCASHEQILSPP